MPPLPPAGDKIIYEDSYTSLVDKEIQTDPTESFIKENHVMTIFPNPPGASESYHVIRLIDFEHVPREVVDEDAEVKEVFKREILLAPENISNEPVVDASDYCKDVAIPYLNTLPPDCDFEEESPRDLLIKPQEDNPDYPNIKDTIKENRNDNTTNMNNNKCDSGSSGNNKSSDTLGDVVRSVQKIVSTVMCPICPSKPAVSPNPAKPPEPAKSEPAKPPEPAKLQPEKPPGLAKSPEPAKPPGPAKQPGAPASKALPLYVSPPPPCKPDDPRSPAPKPAANLDSICDGIRMSFDKVLQATKQPDENDEDLPYCDELPEEDLPFCDEEPEPKPKQKSPKESPCPTEVESPCPKEDPPPCPHMKEPPPCPPKPCPPSRSSCSCNKEKIKDPVIAIIPPACPGRKPKYYLTDRSKLCPPCTPPKGKGPPLPKCDDVSYDHDTADSIAPRHAIALNIETTPNHNVLSDIQTKTGVDLEVNDQESSSDQTLTRTITLVKDAMTEVVEKVSLVKDAMTGAVDKVSLVKDGMTGAADKVSMVKDAMSDAADKVSIVKDAMSDAADKASIVKDAVSEAADKVSLATKDAVTGAADKVSLVTKDAVTGAVKDAVTGAADKVSQVKDAMSEAADKVYDKTQDAITLVDKSMERLAQLSETTLTTIQDYSKKITTKENPQNEATSKTKPTEKPSKQESMQTVESPMRIPSFVTKIADAVDSTMSTLKERLDLDRMGYVIKERTRETTEHSSPYDTPRKIPPREVSHDIPQEESITRSMFTSIKSTLMSFFGESLKKEAASNSSSTLSQGSSDSVPDHSDSLSRFID